MLTIRLTRVGKKKQPQYRVVVADSKRAVQAKFVSIVGWYNPKTKEAKFEKEKIKAWLEKGAQPSNTLAKMLKSGGFDLPKWVKITEKNKKPKKKEEPKGPEVKQAKDSKEEAEEVNEKAAEETQESESSEPEVENSAEEAVEEKKEEESEEPKTEESTDKK